MKIIVDDHAPGASAGRLAYLESRTHRVLGKMSSRLRSIRIELRADEQQGHCVVTMTARLSQGKRLVASSQRRLLSDALADTFDALVTQIALFGIRVPIDEDVAELVHPPSPSATRRSRVW